ncbi:MAG TPA: hypothetical protein VFW27_30095 [Actinoplanes sp.]|nr:hypothetical protein [Actinoplanes sp.]
MTSETDDSQPRDLAVRAAAGAAAAGVGLAVAGPGGALAGAALTPVLEGAFRYLDGRFLRRRTMHAAETLVDAADAVGAVTEEGLEELIEKLVADEEHEELLVRVLGIAQDSAMREKRRALGRILANAADETGTKVDAQFANARVIADLDPVHVRLLRILSLTPPHLRKYAIDHGVDLRSARRWCPWSVAAMDPGLSEAVWGALPVLERNGLVWKVGEVHTPKAGIEPEYEITRYGDYLLALLGSLDASTV